MNAWKVILPTLVIFIAGVITGAVLVKYSVVPGMDKPGFQHGQVAANNGNGGQNPPIVAVQARMRDMLRRMDKELDLTPDQRQHIETLISVSQERTRELWKPVAPAFNKEFQHLKTEIRDQLTDDQKARFDQIFKPRNILRRPGMDSNTPEGAKPELTNAPASPTNS